MSLTPTYYPRSHRSRLTFADHTSKSPTKHSSSRSHPDSSLSPTPTLHSARTYSATTILPIICLASLPYYGTAIQPPSPITTFPCTHRATSSYTAPKPHCPTLGASRCPGRTISAPLPSSDTNSTPRWSSSPMPRSDHHRIRPSTTQSKENGYTTTPTSPQTWSVATNHTCPPTPSATFKLLALGSDLPEHTRPLRKSCHPHRPSWLPHILRLRPPLRHLPTTSSCTSTLPTIPKLSAHPSSS